MSESKFEDLFSLSGGQGSQFGDRQGWTNNINNWESIHGDLEVLEASRTIREQQQTVNEPGTDLAIAV